MAIINKKTLNKAIIGKIRIIEIICIITAFLLAGIVYKIAYREGLRQGVSDGFNSGINVGASQCASGMCPYPYEDKNKSTWADVEKLAILVIAFGLAVGWALHGVGFFMFKIDASSRVYNDPNEDGHDVIAFPCGYTLRYDRTLFNTIYPSKLPLCPMHGKGCKK